MRGDELKGYLAGLRHAATLVTNDAVKVRAEGWATSGAISERLKLSALRIEGERNRVEADHTARGIRGA